MHCVKGMGIITVAVCLAVLAATSASSGMMAQRDRDHGIRQLNSPAAVPETPAEPLLLVRGGNGNGGNGGSGNGGNGNGGNGAENGGNGPGDGTGNGGTGPGDGTGNGPGTGTCLTT